MPPCLPWDSFRPFYSLYTDVVAGSTCTEASVGSGGAKNSSLLATYSQLIRIHPRATARHKRESSWRGRQQKKRVMYPSWLMWNVARGTYWKVASSIFIWRDRLQIIRANQRHRRHSLTRPWFYLLRGTCNWLLLLNSTGFVRQEQETGFGGGTLIKCS